MSEASESSYRHPPNTIMVVDVLDVLLKKKQIIIDLPRKRYCLGLGRLIGDRYDYSKVEYVDTHTKVEIICPKHGSFHQVVWDHINGHGCQKCCQSRLEEEVENALKDKRHSI